MKISVNCKYLEVRPAVEAEVERCVPKVEKLLKRYSPDLAQLHGTFEKHARKEEYTFSLNLSLPTGTLHCTAEGPDVRTSITQAFAELVSQLKKHQSKLRKDYDWRRKRTRGIPGAPAAD